MTSQIALFNIAVVGLLPWGSNGHEKSKNPVNGYWKTTPMPISSPMIQACLLKTTPFIVCFGPGWIAPLTQDMKAFAEHPRLLRVEDRRAGPGGQPLYPGKGGCQVFKRNGLSHLRSTTEWGDTVEYTADSLYGPYGKPRLILAQSGNVGIFQSENGELTAVVGHWPR